MATLAKMRKRGIPWLLIAAVVLAGSGLGAWFLWSSSQGEVREARLATDTAPVIRQDITVEVSAAGVVKPLTPVNISPKQAGKLVALYVEQGDRVRAGQLLARMDASNLRGQLLQAQGSLDAAVASLRKLQAGNRPQEVLQARENLREAQANLIATRSTYESNAKLFASGAISRNTLDVSRSSYESAQARIASLEQLLRLQQAGFRREDIEAARAQVTQARGALETVRVQIADTEIRAPFAGIVTQKYANPGAFVTPTTSASTTTSATSSSILAMAGALEAVVNVAEADIRNIYPGQAVTIVADAYPGRIFKGKVRLVAPEAVVTQNVTSFEVRVALVDDPKLLLKSGMNLRADFQVGTRKNALLIPTTAVVSEGDGTAVFVAGEGRPRLQPIKVGATVGTRTEVLSGLQPGDRVFVTFPGQRKPNDRPVRGSGSPFGGGARGGRPPR